MKIGFLSSDWGDYERSMPGGCTWIRFMNPGQKISELGYEVKLGEVGWKDGEGFVVVPTWARLRASDRDILDIDKYPFLKNQYEGNLDVVVLKLWMAKEASNQIKKAQEYGQTVIVDIDDWFEGLPTTNIAFETTSPSKYPEYNRNHMLNSYGYANGLIVSTQFLYDKYKNKNKNCYMVRNSLDPKLFIKRYDSAGNKPKIGWVGIMLWRSEDIQTLQGWLGDFLEKNDLRFHHSGILGDNPNWFAESAKIDVNRLDKGTGSPPEYYGNILLSFDIGIVPLSKLPFNEAKSNLKGLEYAMTGIPFVAADTYEYRMLSEQGVGNVASKPAEWIKHLEKLLDPKERKLQAEKGYEIVMDKYNLNKTVYNWIEAIEKIHLSNEKRRNK